MSWIVIVTIKDGSFDAFNAVTAEMVADARREHGALVYRRFISPDVKKAFLLETYADSTAALEHIQSFRKLYASRYGALIERREFMVFGTASPELLRELQEYGAVAMRQIAGFGGSGAPYP